MGMQPRTVTRGCHLLSTTSTVTRNLTSLSLLTPQTSVQHCRDPPTILRGSGRLCLFLAGRYRPKSVSAQTIATRLLIHTRGCVEPEIYNMSVAHLGVRLCFTHIYGRVAVLLGRSS